jgi:hypothetical protein
MSAFARNGDSVSYYLLLKAAAGKSHFAVVNVEKELYTWAVSLREAK